MTTVLIMQRRQCDLVEPTTARRGLNPARLTQTCAAVRYRPLRLPGVIDRSMSAVRPCPGPVLEL
jgi:hypothetical protein